MAQTIKQVDKSIKTDTITVQEGRTRFLNLGTTDIWGQVVLRRGAVLYIKACLAASLPSTYQIPVAFPHPPVTTQISADIVLGDKITSA